MKYICDTIICFHASLVRSCFPVPLRDMARKCHFGGGMCRPRYSGWKYTFKRYPSQISLYFVYLLFTITVQFYASRCSVQSLLPYSTFLAPCALNFFRVAAKFLSNFFLLSAHFNRLLYIDGNEFKDEASEKSCL